MLAAAIAASLRLAISVNGFNQVPGSCVGVPVTAADYNNWAGWCYASVPDVFHCRSCHDAPTENSAHATCESQCDHIRSQGGRCAGVTWSKNPSVSSGPPRYECCFMAVINSVDPTGTHVQTGEPQECNQKVFPPPPPAPPPSPPPYPPPSPSASPVTPSPSLSPLLPTVPPSAAPDTSAPTLSPRDPTAPPSLSPTTSAPSVSPLRPTLPPSASPTTSSPSLSPSLPPSSSPVTSHPSRSPQLPSSPPTAAPSSSAPSAGPSVAPRSRQPSRPPTTSPLQSPSARPTRAPSTHPSVGPVHSPTSGPRTSSPSSTPTREPHGPPTASPIPAPTTAPVTSAPSAPPQHPPTRSPSVRTAAPSTAAPSVRPSTSPFTSLPSAGPATPEPSRAPWVSPSVRPSGPPPPPGTALEQAAGGVTGATDGVLGAVGPVAATTGLLSRIDCSVEDLDLDGTAPLDFEFHPLGWAMGSHAHRYFTGAIFWNTMLILAALPLCIAFALFRSLAHNEDFRVALANARFPSLGFLPYFFLTQGTALAASNCTFFPDRAPPAVAALGAATLTVVAAVPFYLWRTLLWRNLRAVTIDDPWLHPNGVRRRISSALWRAYILLHGRKVWVSTRGHYVERYGFVFEQYVMDRTWWLLPELYVMVALSVFAAWRTDVPAQCHARNVLVTLLLGAYFSAMVYFRPYTSPLEGMFQLALALANFVSVLLMSTALMIGSGRTSTAFLSIAAVFLLFSAMLQVLTFCVEMLGYIHSHCVGRRRGAWDHQRRRLRSGQLCVGQLVRVKRNVVTPSEGWQGISRSDVGTVVEIAEDGKVVVEFDSCPKWAGLESEIEVAGDSKTDFFGDQEMSPTKEDSSSSSSPTPPTLPINLREAPPSMKVPLLQQALPAGEVKRRLREPPVQRRQNSTGGASAVSSELSPLRPPAQQNGDLRHILAERLAAEGLAPADLVGWSNEELDEILTSLRFSPPQRLFLRRSLQSPRTSLGGPHTSLATPHTPRSSPGLSPVAAGRGRIPMRLTSFDVPPAKRKTSKKAEAAAAAAALGAVAASTFSGPTASMDDLLPWAQSAAAGDDDDNADSDEHTGIVVSVVVPGRQGTSGLATASDSDTVLRRTATSVSRTGAAAGEQDSLLSVMEKLQSGIPGAPSAPSAGVHLSGPRSSFVTSGLSPRRVVSISDPSGSWRRSSTANTAQPQPQRPVTPSTPPSSSAGTSIPSLPAD
eukprot:TRINITY_DN17135_c0_g1_i1.p1 TRINITY_DN17135_c0_g1~~TRINITY_DN17135_c0_g1_i1.p1  ORF type:complete len:1217 (+),score=181.29 TRINITY_DN17135_c0_g1_i1:54-3704(+)